MNLGVKNAPKPGQLARFTLPAPQKFELKNGLTVLLVERHNLPVVAANLVVGGGAGANPVDRPGLLLYHFHVAGRDQESCGAEAG